MEIREIQTPTPSPNQVLRKINASGLCYTDVHITKGELPLPLNFPLILGHEPAGEIVKVGESVTTRKKGDRVGVPKYLVIRYVLRKTLLYYVTEPCYNERSKPSEPFWLC